MHRDRTQEDSREVEAAKHDLNYIGLTGESPSPCSSPRTLSSCSSRCSCSLSLVLLLAPVRYLVVLVYP